VRTDTAIILTKIQSNHNNLGDCYTGWLRDKPRIGEQLLMDTREEGLLVTTAIRTLRFLSDRTIEFDTKNSTYRIDYLKDDSGEEVYLNPEQAEVMEVFTRRGTTSKLSILGSLIELVQKLKGHHA
jgi:hypothetical protein